MLQPFIGLFSVADLTKANLFDLTGLYSIANPDGYGSPNTPADSIASASISGTIYLPNNSKTTIPVTNIFPVAPNLAPYVYNESYILTPTQLGIPFTLFPDGIYLLTYSVSTFGTITVSYGSGSPPPLAIGDTITDSMGNTGIILTVSPSITFQQTSQNVLVDGAFTATPSGSHGTIVTVTAPTTYTATQQFLMTENCDCGLSNVLSSISACDCGCNKTKELFNNFMALQAAKCAALNLMNNKALDLLNSVLLYISKNSSCGCSQ